MLDECSSTLMFSQVSLCHSLAFNGQCTSSVVELAKSDPSLVVTEVQLNVSYEPTTSAVVSTKACKEELVRAAFKLGDTKEDLVHHQCAK